MTSFSDDFDRADSTDLGAGWVEVSGDWSIVSNQLSPGAAGGTIILRCATAMSTSDNFAQITIAATAAVSQGIWVRGNANITSGYLWRNSGTTWDLFQVVGGSFTNIGTYAAAAAPGDVAKVQAVGTTIKGFVNGVERVSVTDSGVSSGTNVGVRSESSGSVKYDNFSAGDVSATVTGTGAATFGALTGTAAGTPTVRGTGAAVLGALTGTASGTRKVSATGAATFGALGSTVSGTRTVTATGALNGGSLAGTSSGTRAVSASASAAFGALDGSASVAAHITGTAHAELGPLDAAAQGRVPTVSTPSTGSWYGLLDILSEAAQLKKEEMTSPPLACPFDGEPLQSTPDGKGLFCRYDGYRWPEMPRLI